MARAAMRGTLDQITAAIPVSALVLIGFEDARLQEKPVPGAHHNAVVKWPAQLRLLRGVAERRQGGEVSPDCEQIITRHFREIGIGERRVIKRAIWRYPETQGARKLPLGPRAKPGLAIRRKIRGVDA